MYKPQEQQPQVDPLVQVEALKVQEKAASDKRDADVKMAVAELKYQSDAEDRQSKEKIEGLKIAAEAARNLGGVNG